MIYVEELIEEFYGQLFQNNGVYLLSKQNMGE